MEENKGGIKNGGQFKYDPLHGTYIKQNTNPEASYIVAQMSQREKKPRTTGADELFKAATYNGKILTNAADSQMNMFKSIHIPSTSTKSHAQKSIQTIQNMKAGDIFTFFDIENIGTHGGEWYSPLEFGFRQTKVERDAAGKLQFSKTDKALSLLVKPGEKEQKHVMDIFEKLKGIHITGINLTDDERRTVNDLILYGADDAFGNGYFRKDGDMTTILKQNKDQKAMKGTLFTHDQIKAAKRGFENVVKHGTEPHVVAREFLKTLRNGKELKLGGQNINTYDIPFMRDYIKDQLVPSIPKHDRKTRMALTRLASDIQKADSFDTLSIANSLFADLSSKHGLRNQTLANFYGMTGEIAQATHMALQDTDLTVDVANKVFLDKLNVEGIVNADAGNRMNGTWNSNSIKAGDKVFSMTGLPGYESGANDGVFRWDPEKKQLVPAYKGNVNPISKESEYEVVKTFSGKLKNSDNKQSGILLRNLETDLFHFISRDSETDLQSVFHQVFKPSEEVPQLANPNAGNRTAYGLDRARRTYDKMFSTTESGGGRWMLERMYAALDALNEGREKIKRGEIRKSDIADYVQNHPNVQRTVGGTPTGLPNSQYRDLLVMEKRLTQEKKVWQTAMARLDANLPGSNGFTPFSQNVALSNIAKQLDERYGSGETRVRMPNGKGFLELQLPGETTHRIDLSTDATAARNIRSYITKGLDIKENISKNGGVDIGIVKKRLKDVVNHVRRPGASGLTSSEKSQLLRQVSELQHGESPYMVIESMARMMRAEYSHNSSYANHNLDIKDVSSIRKPLVEAYQNPAILEDIIGRGIDSGRASHKSQGKTLDLSDAKFQKALQTHDEALNGLMQISGGNTARGVQTMKAEDVVKQLINSYSGDGMATQLIYDGHKKTYMLAVMQETVMKEVMGLQPNQIIEHAKVASVPIPLLDENMNVTMPGSTKTGYLKAMRMNGKDILGTPLEQLVDGAVRRSSSTKELIRKGNEQEAHSRLRRQAREATEKFSHNNPYTNAKELTKHDSKRSQIAQRAARSKIDVSGWAEEWYSWYDQRYGFEKELGVKNKYQQIKDKSAQSYTSFFENLGMREQRAFHSTIQEFASREKNMYLNAGNVSGEQVLNGIYGTRETSQAYQAFGHYNILAREQMNKTRNYIPLEEREIRSRLQAKGYTSAEIERMIQTSATTTASEALSAPLRMPDGSVIQQKELTGLNVQAVELTDMDIKDRMDEFRKSSPDAYADLVRKYGQGFEKNLTTFEGMSIIDKSLQSVFDTKREKNFTLQRGFELHSDIANFFKQAENNDLAKDGFRAVRTDNGGWRLEGDVMKNATELETILGGRVNNPGKADHGKLTVGQVSIGQNTQYQTEKAWGDGFHVVGYDPETRKLQTQMIEKTENGRKFLTDANHRITTNFFDRDIFEALGVGDAKAIVTVSDISKGMHGTEIEGQVRLAVDEANRLITNSEMDFKNEAVKKYVSDIKDMTQRIFQIPDGDIAMKLEPVQGSNLTVGKLVLNSEHGRIAGPVYGAQQEYDFVKQSSQMLEELAAKAGVINYTAPINRQEKNVNLTLRVADLHKWQDQMGVSETGKEGLVRWTYKEQEAILNRTDQILGRKDHTIGKFVRQQISSRSAIQNSSKEMTLAEETSGILRAINDHQNTTLQKNGVVQEGDIVIRTGGNIMTDLDPDGTHTAVMKDGHLEISQHAFRDPQFNVATDPEMTKGKLGNYAMTLADPRSLQLQIEGLGEGVEETVGSLMKKNGGTFLLELPSNSEHQFKDKYVRLMSPGTMQIGTGPEALEMANEVDKRSLGIWRNIKAYQAAPTIENKEAVEKSVDAYKSYLNYMVTGSHGGTLLDKYSAKMDMSGRFHIEGVNMHEKGLAEGDALIGPKQMRRMIAGAEGDIVQSLAPKRHEAVLTEYNERMTQAGKAKGDEKVRLESLAKQFKSERMGEEALEIAKTNGLYGFTNRYPTINKQTNGVLRYLVDDTIEANTMYVGAGTAKVFKADHDGDNGNAVFNHYKASKTHTVDDIRAVHKEMQQVQQGSIPLYEQAGVEMAADELKHYNAEKLTVGEQLQREIQRSQDYGELAGWGPKTTRLNEMESLLARTGKADIGVLDNLRQRMQTLTNPTYEALAKKGLISQDEAYQAMNILEEFSSKISQDSISSKKISVGALTEEIVKSWGKQLTNDESQYAAKVMEHHGAEAVMGEVEKRMQTHYQAIEMLKEGVIRPDSVGVEKIRKANDILGIFKTSNPNESMNHYGLDTHLDQLQDLYSLSGNTFTENPHLKGMQSGGTKDTDIVSNIVAGGKYESVPTPHLDNIAANNPQFKKIYDEGVENFENLISERFSFRDRALKDSLADTITETPHLSKNTLTEMVGADKGIVRATEAVSEKMSGLAHKMGPGMIGGAIGFGAMWAASALMRSGPTPEAFQEQTDMAPPPPPPVQVSSGPTARVTPNENINISIRAKDAKGMSQQDISKLVHEELSRQTSAQLNMNMNVNDNTQKLDNEWMQTQFANVMGKGFTY
ncbi:virion structural protein_gp095 [Bacillus phage vB_BceM_WH1]|nr:virion structural protein_gp095 [Bacillus phage vB_BceM_WH1]